MCGQTTLVLIFMILVFEVECRGNIVIVVFITILQGLCGMCFGFVISAICELERNAIQLALGSFYPTLLLSGVIWPIEGMPYVLRSISTFLPLTLATTALRSMMTRGWNLDEPDVYYGFIATMVWIVVFLSISLAVLKFKRGWTHSLVKRHFQLLRGIRYLSKTKIKEYSPSYSVQCFLSSYKMIQFLKGNVQLIWVVICLFFIYTLPYYSLDLSY